MAIETDADRLLFLDEDEFGASIVWTSASGSKPAASCIFDDTFVALSAGELEFTQEGGRVQVTMRTRDVPGDAEHEDGATVSSEMLGSKAFRVVEFQPDGTGMTVVRLLEV
ncbi:MULTISPECIES: hypothetical protein [unclassified Ensifer]|uniref:head-tail joining protein n=1 Tax=unclassified Ensifer TaxID=2633371 RepID=UPI00070F8356|nr:MULTISPECIES: hypothetical protein [unclassified Ensifer]KQW62864.1 hypothetical protein ASD02_01710 [Ensifer sp. Root1252]KRC83685.1 hypothetical protein ASE32_01700 [Ensifer sp. Root231]KRD04038.1 hypothetical protein ASE47_00360 [Ensifer sp. Root258]